MSQHQTGVTLAACKHNSRKAGGDGYIRSAVAGREPPLSPSSTAQNPPLFAAACPVLPFELQPCLCGSLAASRMGTQAPPSPKAEQTSRLFRENGRFRREDSLLFFVGSSAVRRRRSGANEACLCRYVRVGMRAATSSFNWFRRRRGRFLFVCLFGFCK